MKKNIAESNKMNEHILVYRIKHSFSKLNNYNEKKILPKGVRIKKSGKKSLRWHVEQNLLKEYSPAAVLIDASGKILYFYGDTGKFLELPSGYIDSFNIKQLAKPELKKKIRKILCEAFLSQKKARTDGAQVNFFGVQIAVNLTAIPLNIQFGKKASHYLVTFELPCNESISSNDSFFDVNYNVNLEQKKVEIFDCNRKLEDLSAAIRNKNTELLIIEKLLNQVQIEFEKNQELLDNSTDQLMSVRKEIADFESKLEQTKCFPRNLKTEILEIRKELAEIKKEFYITVEELDIVNSQLQSNDQKSKDLDDEIMAKLTELDKIRYELDSCQQKLTVTQTESNKKIMQVSRIYDTGVICSRFKQADFSIFFDPKIESESNYFCFNNNSNYLNQDYDEFALEMVDHQPTATLFSTDLNNSIEKNKLIQDTNEKSTRSFSDLEKLTDRKNLKIPQNKIIDFSSSNNINEMVRQERKFLLNMNDFHRHSAYLENFLIQDIHNGATGYMIRSLYFDTLDDRDFHEKENGIEIRRKIRLRNYDPNSDFAMLEIKQKQGKNHLKRSLRVNREDAIELTNGDYRCLLRYTEPFAAECYGIMNMNCYRPKTIVQYDRKAFITNENKTRITLDRNITATESCFDLFSSSLSLNPVFEQFNFILEVKYNSFLLSYIRELINQIDGSEISVSKYCLARSIGCNYKF